MARDPSRVRLVPGQRCDPSRVPTAAACVGCVEVSALLETTSCCIYKRHDTTRQGTDHGVPDPQYEDSRVGEDGVAALGPRDEPGEPKGEGAAQQQVEVGDDQVAHVAVVQKVGVEFVDDLAEGQGRLPAHARVLEEEERGERDGVGQGEELGLCVFWFW